MEICGFEVRTGLSYRKARQPGSLAFLDEPDAFLIVRGSGRTPLDITKLFL